MAFDAQADQQLADIAKLWNAIEGRLKEVEQFRSAAIVATVNEMRYASRRIVDVISRDGQPAQGFDVHKSLAIAMNYLINADHDLTDSVIFFTQERVFATLKRHGRTKVERYAPEFVGLYPSMLEAQRIVKGSREDRESRIAEYNRLAAEYLPQIMALYRHLEAEPRLTIDNSLIEFWVRVNAVLATIGAVAGVLGFVVSVWGVYLIFHPPVLDPAPHVESPSPLPAMASSSEPSSASSSSAR